ncbi:hypothetical protein ACFO5X_00410 [Seohaeicola nanhaiensis]|uniref:Uncharacterized protein n=1 Tax=Seohaeicola nanhaiensis TaxID=1387282 RepID=A0ABV9KAT7_9RHOB
MSEHELFLTARRLEASIIGAPAARRLELQPQLNKVIERLAMQGQQVPARLRNLNAVLLDEAIEDRFDNLPV